MNIAYHKRNMIVNCDNTRGRGALIRLVNTLIFAVPTEKEWWIISGVTVLSGVK